MVFHGYVNVYQMDFPMCGLTHNFHDSAMVKTFSSYGLWSFIPCHGNAEATVNSYGLMTSLKNEALTMAHMIWLAILSYPQNNHISFAWWLLVKSLKSQCSSWFIDFINHLGWSENREAPWFHEVYEIWALNFIKKSHNFCDNCRDSLHQSSIIIPFLSQWKDARPGVRIFRQTMKGSPGIGRCKAPPARQGIFLSAFG